MWRATSLLLVAMFVSGCPGRTAVPCNDDEDCGRNEECSLGFCRPIVDEPVDAGTPVVDAGVVDDAGVADAGTVVACAPANEMRAGGTVVCGNVAHVVGSSAANGVRVDADPRATPIGRTPSTGGAFTAR